MGDSFSELVVMYEKNARSNLEKLQQALVEKNRLNVTHAAHGLKGCSGNIGASELFELCDGLEYSSEHEAFPDLQKRLSSIEVELDGVVEYFSGVIARKKSA